MPLIKFVTVSFCKPFERKEITLLTISKNWNANNWCDFSHFN